MPATLSFFMVLAIAWHAIEESPGQLLSPGTQLVYSSGGRENPPWIVEAIVRDTTLGGIASCSVIHLRTSPTQQAPEVRAQCQRGDTLFAWDAASLTHRPLRPLGPAMSLEVRGRAGTTSTFETGARGVERIGAYEVPVIPTVVTTRDSAGRIVRRLRERFSIGLATATGGTFEVPDSASSQGWRTERAFELIRFSPASTGAGAPAAALIGDFTDDYGIRYTITPSLWTQWPSARYHVQRWNASAGYLIARNDDANPTDRGLWTRIDWIPLQAMPPYEWAFCLSAYKAPSAAAAESVTIARRDAPRTGCNGFPFSRMKKSAQLPQDVVRQLESTDWVLRASAFDSLRRKVDVVAASELAKVLPALLDRENQIVAATLRESKGMVGVSGKYGEGYAEYYNELLETCDLRCNKHDPNAIRTLASGAYSPSSPFAQQLAANYGAEIMPLMLQKSRDRDLAGFRIEAVIMLGKIAQSNPRLPAAHRELIHKAVVESTSDSVGFVRQEGVRVLADIGNASDLAALRKIAQGDTDASVRKEAVRAIEKLSRR